MTPARQPQTLLIIDDNADNLRVAVEMLTAYSFEIRTARDGETGIRRARNGAPDLILLDVQMPGIDGYETCRRLKADPALVGIPVIFMTARSDIADKVQAFDVGGVDYVTKPFEARELLARVRTHLQLRALQRELSGRNTLLEERVEEQTVTLRAELSLRTMHDQQRDRLLGLVRAQSEELRRLTRRWMDEQQVRNQDLAASLKEHITTRLELVRLHLGQAKELLPSETGDWADPAGCRQHLETAEALLAPIQRGSLDIQTSLTRPAPEEEDPLLSLSTREYEVMQLLAEGRTNKEIAFALGVAPSTVSTYRMRILEKLGTGDIPALIRLLIRHEARCN